MKKIYSQKQCVIGTILGGPLAAIYMFFVNMGMIHNTKDRFKAIYWGLPAFIIITILALSVEFNMIGFYLTIFCALLVAHLVKQQDFPNYEQIKNSTIYERFTNINLILIALIAQIINLSIVFILLHFNLF